jgi:hypothetical protein
VGGDAPATVVPATPPMGARVSVPGTAPWRRAPREVSCPGAGARAAPGRSDPATVPQALGLLDGLAATHDPDALAFADRVLRLADGQLSERTP